MKNPTSDLRCRRKEMGLTLEEVGNFVGVSKGTVSKWENGNIKNMKSDKVSLLAKILDTTVIDVIRMCSDDALPINDAVQHTPGMKQQHKEDLNCSTDGFFIHPEDLAAMKRSYLSDGSKQQKYMIAYPKDGTVVFDRFSKEDFDFLMHTIEMLKGKSNS